MRFTLFILTALIPYQLFSQVISENLKKVNYQNGYIYVGANTFLNVKLYNTINEHPQILSLYYDESPTPLLLLTELDCKNRRIMHLAYKNYENIDIMPKEHYLFEHLKKWEYAESGSKELIMLNCVCVKYGYWSKPIKYNE